MMDVAEVRRRVDAIYKMSGDYEAAHGAEDTLRRDVLESIAGGCLNAPELAATALLTRHIEFARYCA